MIWLARALARRLPYAWRQRLRAVLALIAEKGVWPRSAYSRRLSAENRRFASDVDVHALPEIAHYWSNTYLLPMQQAFGFNHPEEFFGKFLFEAARRTGARAPRFVSLGAGNCDAEVRIAADLRARGLENFTFECLEINPAMRQRGAELARQAGLEQVVLPMHGDFNAWQPAAAYDGIMANQSLHHVLELERLFDAVHSALHPDGLFVISDMIGRNGHRRWPEAAEIVREFWRELPESHRYNLQLRRHEPVFMDWDCSVEGFEGIRSQDILPLLLERFGFELFFVFGNVIDPFVDRGFGHHFNASRTWDREFIDRVHARDETELQSGRIKPTHMIAALVRQRNVRGQQRLHLSPEFCVRHA